MRLERLNWLWAGAIGFVILLAEAGQANAETAGPDPAPDVAFISVPEPRVASLLQLRGMAGRGSAIFRLDGRCGRLAVRLVAGDFAGMADAGERVRPILLKISGRELTRALAEGQDLVSDSVTISSDGAEFGAGVTILDGLPVGAGFVINPGSSILADMFGARVAPLSCHQIETLAASLAVGHGP